jgi:hypothetical protein
LRVIRAVSEPEKKADSNSRKNRAVNSAPVGMSFKGRDLDREDG